MKVSLLTIKPNKNIPDLLIYSPLKKGWYNMCSAKTGSLIGFAQTAEAEFKGKKAFFIEGLLIEKPKKGFGSKFLDFFKILSKNGCNSTIFLEANSLFLSDFSTEPHAFYRKNGFTTDDQEVLKKIDNSIKANRNLTFFDVPPTVMYWQDKGN